MLNHLILQSGQLLVNPSLSGAEINMMTVKEHVFMQELPSVIKVLAEPENPARYSYFYDRPARRVITHLDGIALECDG